MAAFRTLDDIGDVNGKVALVRVDSEPADGRRAGDRPHPRPRRRADDPRARRRRRQGAAARALRPAQGRAPLDDVDQPDPGRGHRSARARGDVRLGSLGPGGRAVDRHPAPGDIALLENTRFWPGEEKNDPEFARAIAANGDFYVNDAFSASHRAHATTEGLAHQLPAYAGRAMQAELVALDKALGTPEKPVAAVVGGAKVRPSSRCSSTSSRGSTT
jgi:phosphoglycerate kinase